MGAAADLRIRKLAREKGGDLRRGEPPPGKPHPLHRSRGRDRHHPVHPPATAHLEQQRHVEHHYRGAGTPGTGKEGAELADHQRVHDRLQPGESRRLGKHAGTKRRARQAEPSSRINRHHLRKGRTDAAQRRAVRRL